MDFGEEGFEVRPVVGVGVLEGVRVRVPAVVLGGFAGVL